MTKISSSDSNTESRGSHLLLLRLSESGGWDQPVHLHCWSDRGWRPVDVDEEFVRAFNPSCEPGPTPEDALQLTFPEGARALLLLPGNWVWSGVERVPKAARRQSHAVGYLVEERLAEDVEDLHFVCRPRSGEDCSVYAVARKKMAALHGQLERLQWPVVTAAPEYQLLDLMGQDIALWLDGSQAHIWHRAGHGLSVRRQYLQPLLAQLARPDTGDKMNDEMADEQPPELALLGVGDGDGLALAELESLFAEHLHPVTGSAEEALLSRYKPGRLVNLLVDEYQLDDGTEERNWWLRPAKVVAACFAAQLILFIAAGGYYQWRASAAEQEARALFSELLPNVSPSADLRRQINGYLNRAGGSDSSFASQLQLLSRVWGQQKGTELKLQSLRFDGNRGEMVLQLQAPNLTDLDAVVGNLSSGGQYRAELLAASELDEGVSGRIRLR